MAGKKLEYEIVTDPSKGITGLKQFAGAAKKAMRDVDDALEGTSTNAKKVADALSGMADEMEAEMKGAARAADALSTALGPELAGRADIDKITGDLRNMGLTFDEITADADVLAASLKDLDRVTMSAPAKGMQDMADTTKRVKDETESTSSSVSSMANSIGNNASEMGAALGLSGPLGQSIGEFGEYMSEARLEGEGFGTILSNFGKFAGPIAALSIGIGLVTKAIGDVQKKNAEIAKNSEAIAEGIAADFEQIDEAADFGNVDKAADLFSALAVEFVNTQDTAGRTLKALHDTGIGIDKLGETLVALDQGTKGRLAFFENFVNTSAKFKGGAKVINDAIARAIVRGDDWHQINEFLEDDLGKIGGSAVREGKKILNANKDVILSLEQIDDAAEAISIDQVMKTTTDELLRAEGGLDAYLQSVAKGGTKVEILDRALQIYNRHLRQVDIDQRRAEATSERQTQLAQDQADMISKITEETEAAEQAARDYADTVAGTEWGASELEGAITGMDRFHDQLWGLADIAINAEEAWDNFGASLKENGRSFDVNTEAGRNNMRALEDIARTVDVRLADAYNKADGNQKTFRDSATRIANETLTRLREEFGFTADQARDFAEKLGLLPADIETRYELSGIAEAQMKLDLLSSSIEGLPEDVKTKVTQQIIAGDYVAALDTVENYYKRNHADLPVDGTVGDVETARREMQRYYYQNGLRIPVYAVPGTRGVVLPYDAGGTVRGAGLVAEKGPEILDGRYLATQPMIVPAGTRVTSRTRTARIMRHGGRHLRAYDSGGVVAGPTHMTINVNAAVVGNRFDVMRAVQRGQRDADRMLGRRGR